MSVGALALLKLELSRSVFYYMVLILTVQRTECKPHESRQPGPGVLFAFAQSTSFLDPVSLCCTCAARSAGRRHTCARVHSVRPRAVNQKGDSLVNKN